MPIKRMDTAGHMRYAATFERHNGNTNETNNPTYDVEADWKPILEGWYCELIGKGGGENVLGRQTVAETTHILNGNAAAITGKGIQATDRVKVGGMVGYVTVTVSPKGLQQRIDVEVKLES